MLENPPAGCSIHAPIEGRVLGLTTPEEFAKPTLVRRQVGSEGRSSDTAACGATRKKSQPTDRLSIGFVNAGTQKLKGVHRAFKLCSTTEWLTQ